MNQSDYDLLNSQLHALLDNEHDALAASGNFVALLYNALDDVNWLGIYVLRDDELVLGPFQGKPACTRIALDEGVCGAAASTGSPTGWSRRDGSICSTSTVRRWPSTSTRPRS